MKLYEKALNLKCLSIQASILKEIYLLLHILKIHLDIIII